jgi:DNA mismatch repair protein MutS2
VAIVDHFRQNNAQIIASTHYKGLKIYATNDEEVINASVEFNEKTLQPTYRLLTGLAGASSGLEIARRFGIRDAVIEKARENLNVSAQEAENYLHKLQKETKQAEDLRIALEEERQTVAEKYADLDIDFRKKEKKRRGEFENELNRTIRNFEKQTREFLKTLKDKKEQKKFEKKIAGQRANLRRMKEEVVKRGEGMLERGNEEVRESGSVGVKQKLSTQYSVSRTTDKPVTVGSKVLLKSFGTIGKVEKISGKEADVLVGSIRMKQRVDNLQVVEVRSPKSKVQSQKDKLTGGENLDSGFLNQDFSSELNLIGKTTLEAEDEIDQFLDDSFVSKLQKVRIVHGFGTGVLKNFVHQLLRRHPHVASFGFAPQNEGGNGATIVEIKQ